MVSLLSLFYFSHLDFVEIILEGNDIQRYKDLEDVRKQIVEKCCGLPLAVKTRANALRKKVRGKQPHESNYQTYFSGCRKFTHSY